MIPLRLVTGGGDQVKTTRLWSASASNTSGEPDGAVEEVVIKTSRYAVSFTNLRGSVDDSLWW